jgi:hypothetical protein
MDYSYLPTAYQDCLHRLTTCFMSVFIGPKRSYFTFVEMREAFWWFALLAVPRLSISCSRKPFEGSKRSLHGRTSSSPNLERRLQACRSPSFQHTLKQWVSRRACLPCLSRRPFVITEPERSILQAFITFFGQYWPIKAPGSI